MKKGAVIWLIVIIVVVVLGIWWYASSMANNSTAYNSNTAATTPTDTTNGTSASGTTSGVLVLNTATDPTLGTFLVATNGMTLYHYTKDTANKSNCTGACATAWPPYTVTSSSSLPAGLGINGQIGAITRADGTIQVTYNGEPVYFYANDAKPGDTTGQNVGKVWFVVAP